MDYELTKNHIIDWLTSYSKNNANLGFVVGISGGIDSAVTSYLCALTGIKTILVNMPIRQSKAEYDRAVTHIHDLTSKFKHVETIALNLTSIFEVMEQTFTDDIVGNSLVMANTRSRLRMTTLYAVAQTNQCLVVGTGNKIEDFGVGFFTKYGDGGVDISPIADLTKSDVRQLAKILGVSDEIIQAKPTDGLWGDERSDEDQLGATYEELEWAMNFQGPGDMLTVREKEVLAIYKRLNSLNQHKMNPIPVCLIPNKLN